jgi:3-hydroxybutyryl-CoA dehydrogenase
MNLQTIGIIGAGTMGNGIAQACASAGLSVILQDISDEAIARGMKTLTGSLDRLVKKGSLDEMRKLEVLSRVRTTTQASELAPADLVIEAATENEALKIRILQNIDGILAPGKIIATNTSSISITRLATAIRRPEQFVGMHFFNPVPVMALVEVIRGLRDRRMPRSRRSSSSAEDAGARHAIGVKNSAGFVVNRILCPMINEAIFALQEGSASAEEIDAGMKLGCQPPDRHRWRCADLIRPRRAAGGDGSPLRRLQRPQVPARPAAARDGRRGHARTQDRARFLRLLNGSCLGKFCAGTSTNSRPAVPKPGRGALRTAAGARASRDRPCAGMGASADRCGSCNG